MSFDFTARPGPGEFGEYHVGYLAAVPAGDIREVLANESQAAVEFYRRLPAPRAEFSYAPGKWTIAETMAHIADGERVFAYRALRFGRGDRTPLAGFDQDPWVPASHADSRPWADLVADFEAVRTASLHLFRSFAEEDWARTGEASGVQVSVRALAFILIGHELHHRRIFVERYGITG